VSSGGLHRFALLTSLAGAIVCRAAPAGAQAPTDDRAAVLAIADSALAAISRTDFIALTDLMIDSAVTFAAGERNGEPWVASRTRAQQRALHAEGSFTERGFDPEVTVAGPIAVVWLPYDFYVDGRWSRCGVDAFTLLRTEAGWRIATVAWSVAQPPACQQHPDGPPAK
jgi:hypothetical protein